MRLLPLLLAVCVGTVTTVTTVFTQVRYRPTETGPWRPWSFSAVTATRQQRGATAAEVQAFQARLQELSAIVKRAPAVSTPIGFAGELWGHLDSYGPVAPGQPPGRAVPLAGALSFGAFPLIEFQRNGRLANEDLKGGETELLQFAVNQLEGHMYGTSRPQGWGEALLDAFVEPESGAAVAGLPRIGDVFVVRKNSKPLWVPFPLADALQPVAVDRRTIYENRRDAYARQVAEFAEWKTPASRAARRADWKQSAALMGARAPSSSRTWRRAIRRSRRPTRNSWGPAVRRTRPCARPSATSRRSTGSSRRCRRTTGARHPATTIGPARCPRASA